MTGVALVTGCSSGIGLACARGLAAHGYTVVATARDPALSSALAALAEDHAAFRIAQLDVTDDASVGRVVSRTLDEFGAIDVLVNNAGVGYNATVEDADLGRVAAVLDTNVLGAWRCTRAVLPSMRRRGSGAIAVISSVMSGVPMLGQAAYVASKSALVALSRCVLAECGGQGVRTIVLEPSVVQSNIFEKNLDLPAPTDYGRAYDHLYDFYGRALAEADEADVVASSLLDALGDGTPYAYRACGWHGDEIARRSRDVAVSEWSRLGAAADTAAFRTALEDLLGIPADG